MLPVLCWWCDEAAEVPHSRDCSRIPSPTSEGMAQSECLGHGAHQPAQRLPSEVRGLGYGVLGTVNGLGDLFSSIIVGLLWTYATPGAGFGYVAVLSLAGAFLIVRVR
jgi:hypothetical protein